MINLKIHESQGFLSSLDILIIKNRNGLGTPGSYNFNKSLKNSRKYFLNKWFVSFNGIHTNQETLCQPTSSDELENKVDFYSFLLKLNETRQFDLKFRLENVYNKAISTKNTDVYAMVQFLLALQDTDNVKLDEFRHFERVDVPTSIKLYGDTRSVNTSETGFKFDLFPTHLFQEKYQSKQNIVIDKSNEDKKLQFINDLSHRSTVRSTITDKSSSGYCTEISDKNDQISTENKENINSSLVSYPFSEFCGKSQVFSDYWETEIIAEWNAFIEGQELLRRFVWEDRGKNVGHEKPRITEWRPGNQINALAVSKSIFLSRYAQSEPTDLIRTFLNVNSVPISSWIKDVIFLRLGISSTTFKYDKASNRFQLFSVVPKFMLEQLDIHIKAGTIFARLSLLVDTKLFPKESLIRDRLLVRLSDILAMHREVLSNINNDFLSLTNFSGYLYKLTSQLEYLGHLFGVDPDFCEMWPQNMLQNSPLYQGGMSLLKHLYETTSNLIAHPFLMMTFYLLEGCFNVVLEQIRQWLYQGMLFDRYYINQANDFFIETNDKYSTNKDSHWWSHGFKLCQSIDESRFPWIFDSLSTDILRCGKSMKLLTLIDEMNPIIHNTEIIRSRPSLKLSYSFRNHSSKPVLDYIAITQNVAAQHLKSQLDRIADKRNLEQIKIASATMARENFLKKELEKIRNRQMEIRRRKKVAFDDLKDAADNEIKAKREKIEQEKMADKVMIDKFKEENRDIIEEIKYEMTKAYAKQIADVETREKVSLEKIQYYQEKLMKTVKQSGIEKNEIDNTNKIILHVVQECVEDVLPIDSNENVNKQLNSPGRSIRSSIQESLYPDTNLKASDQSQNIDKFNTLSIHSQASQSSVQQSLYPDTNPHTCDQSESIDNFKKVNIHGQPSQSSVQESLYPGTNLQVFNQSQHSDNFKKVNIHGHTSDSTAQNDLYPESNPQFSNEPLNHAKAFAHPSDSTAQNSMYTGTNPDTSSQNYDFVSAFKQINIHGHSSQSTIQTMMYPLPKYPVTQQTNNSSSIRDESNEIMNSISNKSTMFSDFVNSFYSVDFKSISKPINRMLIDQSEEKKLISNEIIDLEDELLETLVNRSLVFSIMSHVKLVDSMIINSILNDFHFRTHLKEIRKYLFLQDGHFSSALLPHVFDLLSDSKSSSSSSQWHKLDDIVKSAVNCSHVNVGDCFCANVSYSLKSAPNSDAVMFNNKLDEFSIGYSIKWPLNIVVNSRQLHQYQSIFRGIVQMKYALWSLGETRMAIKSWYSKSARSKTVDLNSFRPLYTCLMEMEHWVRQIDSCLGNQVSGSGVTSWKTFMDDIDNGKCSDLDWLIRNHSVYLDEIVIRCLLGGDYTESASISSHVKSVRVRIRRFIIDILTLVCDYQRIVSVSHWQCRDSVLEVHVANNEQIIRSVVAIHKRFKFYVGCLLPVLRSVSQDPCLGHLLVALDFNQFYNKPTTV